MTVRNPNSLFNSLLMMLLFPLVIVGCAAPTTKVDISVLEPAKSADAPRLRRIAVMQFQAQGDLDITGDVETMLAGIVVNDRRYFDVVERRQLKALLIELKLGERGALDDSTVSRLGKMLGANGVYMGTVTRAAWSDQRSDEPRKICVRRKIKRTKKGKTYESGCAQWRDTVAHCTIRTANFDFLPKLVSIETGAIVYSRHHAGETKSKSCREPGTGANAAEHT